jgi:hypothetical protein
MAVNFWILNQKYFQVVEKGKATFMPVRGFVRMGCERNSDYIERCVRRWKGTGIPAELKE